jgi:transcriptional regulator with XRE-family HTH domain
LTVCHIGKETNLLEQQEEGVLRADPQAIYLGGGQSEAIRFWLRRVSIPKLAARSGVRERMLRNLRRGGRRPSAKTVEAITAALAEIPRRDRTAPRYLRSPLGIAGDRGVMMRLGLHWGRSGFAAFDLGLVLLVLTSAVRGGAATAGAGAAEPDREPAVPPEEKLDPPECRDFQP